MSKLKNNQTTITSTDLYYENLADPSKLRPINQTAKIVKNNDSDDEDSYIVDINNNISNKPSPKLNFNSEQKKDLEKQILKDTELKESKESKESKEIVKIYKLKNSSSKTKQKRHKEKEEMNMSVNRK